MSWLGKQWKSVKRAVTHPVKWAENAGRTLGKGAKIAAPFLPPGFREVAAEAGSLAAGDNRKEQLMNMLTTEVGGMAGGQAAGQSIAKGAQAIKAGGLDVAKQYATQGAKNMLTTPQGMKRVMSFAGGPTSPGGAPTPTFPGGGGGTPSVPGADGGTDWMSIAEGGLAGLSALNSARASQQAGKYGDMAVKHATDRWAEGDPLRVAGRNQMLHPVTPDLTSVYNDPNNAFSRPVSPPGAPQAIRRPMMAPPRRAFR